MANHKNKCAHQHVHQYARMREELIEAVVHMCGECSTPLVPHGPNACDNPVRCPCRCERVRVMLESIVALGNGEDSFKRPVEPTNSKILWG